MMRSRGDGHAQRTPPAGLLAIGLGVAGALVALAVALLTVGVQATVVLWLTTLVPSILAFVLAPRLRGGRPLGRAATLVAGLSGALLGTGLVLGLARLWDAGVTPGWDAVGFLALVGAAFALLQLA